MFTCLAIMMFSTAKHCQKPCNNVLSRVGTLLFGCREIYYILEKCVYSEIFHVTEEYVYAFM